MKQLSILFSLAVIVLTAKSYYNYYSIDTATIEVTVTHILGIVVAILAPIIVYKLDENNTDNS